MATIKNFGIAGVSSDVQFGKGGNRVVSADVGGDKAVSFYDESGTSPSDLVLIRAKTPSGTSGATPNAVATKEYVDSVAAGLDPKASVRVATTSTAGNITLSGLQTIDGVTLVAGDRVLVKNQTNAVENGIYDVAAGAWVRSEDFDGTPAHEVSGGAFTFVEEGTKNANTGWVVTSNGNRDVGTDTIEFAQFSGAGSLTVLGGDGIAVASVGTEFTVSADVRSGSVINENAGGTGQLGIPGGTAGTVLIAQGGTDEAAFGPLDLDVAASHTGTLSRANGGTDTDTSAFAADSLMVTTTTGVAEIAAGAAGTVLKGTGATPVYGSVDLTADVSGILPIANGGTARDALSNGAVLIGAGTSPVDFVLSAQDVTKYLRSGAGSTDAPSFEWISQLHDSTDGSLVIDTAGASADANLLVDVATSNTVKLEAAGSGTDVDMEINPKGTGLVSIDGLTYPKAADVTDDFEGAVLNLIADNGTELQLSFPSWLTDDLNTGFQSWSDTPGNPWTVAGSAPNFTFTVNWPGVGYINSRKVTWTGGQTPVALAANATSFIYIDINGDLQVTTTVSQALYENSIVLFEALNDGVNVTVVRENHPFSFDTQVSAYLHRVVGTVISGVGENVGADITTGATGDGVGSPRVQVTSGGFVEDHGLRDEIAATNPVVWNVYYTNGSGQWTRDGAPRENLYAQWDDNGTVTNTENYAVYTLYVSKKDLVPGEPVKFFAVMDDAAYANAGAAQTAINDGSVRGQTNELYLLELTRLAYVIINGGGTTNTNDDELDSITISKEVLGSQILAGGGGGTAASVTTNTAAFNNILGASHTTVQAALDALDDHILGSHADVSVGSAVTNDLLRFDGSEWVNVAPNSVGIGSYSTINGDSGTASTTVGNDQLTFIGAEGIITTAANDTPADTLSIALRLDELNTKTTPVLGDSVPLIDSEDSNNNKKATWTSIVSNLDIVRAVFANGIITKTANDTYVGRSIAASAVDNLLGINVVNGDGVAGNPTVGLDITGLTATTTNLEATDELAMYDSSATANRKVSLATLFDPAENPALADTQMYIVDAAGGNTYVTTGTNTATPEGTADTVSVVVQGDVVAEFTSDGTSTALFDLQTGTDSITLAAEGSEADIDIILSPKGTGSVVIGDGTGDGLIQSEDDSNLTVKGGDSPAAEGMYLILEGGDGATDGGSIILRPGDKGTGAEGHVFVQAEDEGFIAQFVGTENATADSWITFANGEGEVTIGSAGATNADIILDPAGTGLVVAPTGYDMSGGPTEAFVTKGYVDNAISTGAVARTASTVMFDAITGTSTSSVSVPAGARVYQVIVKVNTGDAGSTLTVGYTGQTSIWVTAAEVDTEAAGTYVINLLSPALGSAQAPVVTITGSPNVDVLVLYRNPDSV